MCLNQIKTSKNLLKSLKTQEKNAKRRPERRKKSKNAFKYKKTVELMCMDKYIGAYYKCIGAIVSRETIRFLQY